MKTVVLAAMLFVPTIVKSQPARLSVLSEPPGAEVFLDSLFIGITPVIHAEVQSGFHHLRLYYPSVRDWNSIARAETLHLVPGEQMEKTVELGSVFSVHSIPSGALVYEGSTELGMTPLFYRSSRKLNDELVLRLPGFAPSLIGTPARSNVSVLTPLVSEVPAASEVEFTQVRNPQADQWATYSAAGAMVVSGVIAAYYKHQANSRFDRYLSTKNPADLAATDRSDRRSAIALIVTQVSFAVLTYFLLSD